ncbi:MAG: 2-hydroxyacid dehydrogenase [Clostridiales bacterium]|nr:2-hydroxyacid dehydrogenase [Clostridiales bacterium]
MKILFYGTKAYDRESFDRELDNYKNIEIDYLEDDLNKKNAQLSRGYEAVCAFVSSDVGTKTVEVLSECGVKLILMRCAGFNNVDLKAASEKGITVLRVPGYSPEAVAEHAMGLALAVNRHIHKGYIKVRENNFALNGLMGVNFYGKTAGIIGTGKIGEAMCRICRGFGMTVIAYDIYKNKNLDFVEYKPLDEVLSQSDLISLHCPLTDDNYHMINKNSISKMKDKVVLINTSRGALIDTDDLIQGIISRKFFGVGLDVYEEETKNVFEDRGNEIVETFATANLLSFPNVIITSHQGFFTEEAMEAISNTTLRNAEDFIKGSINAGNVVG